MKQKGKRNRQQKMGVKLKGILRGNSGVTLVELIVTFALISLFAVSCTQIISSAMGVYHKIRGLNYALQVSDTLMEKITGGIEGALDIPLDEESGDTTAVSITGDANIIELRDRTESHICITTTDQTGNIDDYKATGGTYTKNQLLIYYYPVKGETSAEYRYEAVDWIFDEAVYMGFAVKTLSFEQPALTESTDYAKNIIKVTLELYSDKYGTFRSERYVRCYNFATEQDMEKIKSDGGSTGGGGEEPGGGGENPPDVPPVVPDEDENGFISVDSDKNISFHQNSKSYQELWKEADKYVKENPGNPTKIKIPKGIYEEDGQYYIFPYDREINGYDMKNNLEAYWNMVRGEKLCFKVDGTKLYTQSDIVEKSGESKWTDWKDGKAPIMGSILLYEGRYYVCIEPSGGFAPANPVANPVNWFDISDFVNEK